MLLQLGIVFDRSSHPTVSPLVQDNTVNPCCFSWVLVVCVVVTVASELGHTLHMFSAGVHCLFVSLAAVPTTLQPAVIGHHWLTSLPTFGMRVFGIFTILVGVLFSC